MNFTEKVRIAKKELPIYKAILTYKKAKNELFRVSMINDIHNTPVTRDMYEKQYDRKESLREDVLIQIGKNHSYYVLCVRLMIDQDVLIDDILDLIQWIELESVNYNKGE